MVWREVCEERTKERDHLTDRSQSDINRVPVFEPHTQNKSSIHR